MRTTTRMEDVGAGVGVGPETDADAGVDENV
jgi:hypothetical protein